MVRRLPVLQSSPPGEAPLVLSSAVMLVVPAVLLGWAVLLWGVGRFGHWGIGASYLLANALAAGTVGHRVVAGQRSRFGALGAPLVAVCVWAATAATGVFEDLEIAAASFGALLALGAAGFGLGLLGLFWRQRAARSVRR